MCGNTKKDGSHIKFRWLDEPEDTFFEFRVQKDEITSDIILIVTDFVDEGEEEESQLLWDSQVNNLMHSIGSI